jgi:hypothetical protein
MLTKDYLHEMFDYKDGHLYWKNAYKNITNGQKAGSLHPEGYVRIKLNKSTYGAHRLIFMMHHGYLPIFLDHINGNRSDNRIENLREATKAENRMNSKIASNNKSGIKNVNWHKKSNKWVVQLGVNNKKMNFGTYFDLDVAKFVADTMRHKYHGQFSRNV